MDAVDAKDADPEPPTTEPETETAKDTEPEPVREPEIVEMEKAPPLPAEEPVMPTAAEAARATARRRGELLPRPRVLTYAFYLAIASGVIGAASSIVFFSAKSALIVEAQKLNTKLSADGAESAVNSLLWLYLVVVVALGAFLVLFAYKAMEGVRRARMMGLIITLLLVFFHFGLFGLPIGLLSALLAAVAIAMMYLPSTREYFPPRQSTR